MCVYENRRKHKTAQTDAPYTAFIRQSGTAWEGWFLDILGLSARETTREALIETLENQFKTLPESVVPQARDIGIDLVEIPAAA